ncbi:DUF756 domain-containing protein [Sphingomonas koreensis]|nr:DUF756 domain-containing protein [Sphingomonas koreensis]
MLAPFSLCYCVELARIVFDLMYLVSKTVFPITTSIIPASTILRNTCFMAFSEPMLVTSLACLLAIHSFDSRKVVISDSGEPKVSCRSVTTTFMPACTGRQHHWSYTIGAGDAHDSEQWHEGGVLDAYDLSVHGPNGFFRRYAGSLAPGAPAAEALLDRNSPDGAIRIALINNGATPLNYVATLDAAYRAPQTQEQRYQVAAGHQSLSIWHLASGEQRRMVRHHRGRGRSTRIRPTFCRRDGRSYARGHRPGDRHHARLMLPAAAGIGMSKLIGRYHAVPHVSPSDA